MFAFWAARPGLLTPAHVAAFQKAREYGLKHAEDLARAYRQSRLDHLDPGDVTTPPLLSENAYADAWFKPFDVEYEFTYVGIGKKGGY